MEIEEPVQINDPDKHADRRRIRVGLLVDSFLQPRWIQTIIEDVQKSTIAELSLVIMNAAPNETGSRFRNYWRNRQQLLFAFYNRIDALVARPQPDAFEVGDIKPLVAEAPVLEVVPIMKKYSDWLSAEDLDRIRSYDLDVALRFGFRILRGGALDIAKQGVWSYHHGDASVNRGGPAGFWEVVLGEPTTGAMLQRLSEDLDNGTVLYKSWSPTSDRFSTRLNRNHYYWKSSAFVMRMLQRLHCNLTLSDQASSFSAYSHRLFKTPTNAEMVPLISKLTARYLASKTRGLWSFDQWILAYRFKTSATDLNNSLYKFKYLMPPRDRFWADPFPVKTGDRYYIFFEEYFYEKARGHISVLELDRKGITMGPELVLERPYHLSYPFVFEWENQFYMIPETGTKRTIELFRCTEFPIHWELDTVLMENVNATDATLIRVDELWWMFVNIGERAYPSDWDELYLYYSSNLRGPWTPHPMNPLKSDARGSRPAGRLFYWNDKLHRPAQNSTGRYGYGISMNEVIRLTKDDYLEREVNQITPAWDKRLVATHTLNFSEDLSVIDCLMRRRRILKRPAKAVAK
jgi:hypothetical protein